MGNRWIPDDNGELDTMATAIATTIARDPRKYALDAQLAGELTRAAETFRASRAPRFSGVARRESRKELVQVLRRIGRVVRASDQLSNADKAALFIYPRDPRPAGHGPPTTMPLLTFTGA